MIEGTASLSAMENTSEPELLLQQEGALVQVTMNRPKALNALSYQMIDGFTHYLPEWERDERVKAVLIKGAGDRAFCAGGDVKAAHMAGTAFKRGEITLAEAASFYADEYRLNRSLFHARKPLIALMNGIVMGGGYGIAGPCRYRICAEDSLFAMPETAIGFFPDIGGVYYLAQAPGEIGAYLAITGDRIPVADIMYCGLATHYIPQDIQPDFLKALLAFEGDDTALKTLMDEFSSTPEAASVLQDKQVLIDRCFGFDTVEDIVAALKAEDDPWCAEKLELLQSRSPLSVKVALQHFRMAQNDDFDSVIERDFVLAQNFLKAHDFYEGVRAVLIDRDNKPAWQPANLSAVSDALVSDYFLNVEQILD